ncbi:uncharacterized protein BT62DRAFT_748784 [Guyanagaster necrorhizus]|uniref:Uncharacterized protein n=1 Tax=Guyanagaster necrorhizus TaxID=856835 RepID=A0A9P7VWJ1_9AGAR|nr:uncharacterized protein BT62DRAFT_748784 [Guyanagaster necrorhizus MCA 3950]KAG7448015.1 hypothetical protein BT62DRAFT_748784 [Guyanagaster necrorhizus MCA 3950]
MFLISSTRFLHTRSQTDASLQWLMGVLLSHRFRTRGIPSTIPCHGGLRRSMISFFVRIVPWFLVFLSSAGRLLRLNAADSHRDDSGFSGSIYFVDFSLMLSFVSSLCQLHQDHSLKRRSDHGY